ncbi:threonine synthase [Bradyrhizobium liaoningense]
MAPRCNSSKGHARSRKPRPSASRARPSTPATIGSRSSSKAPNRSPTRSGRISAFAHPDNVIVPVGAGSSLLGCAFGFRELLKAGQISKLPRLFAAQPLNCSPIDASFKAGVDTPVVREVHKTIAEGTAIKNPLRLREIIGALRESGGRTIALTEDVVAALRRLALQGLFAEPTSASAAAALDKLAAAGAIKATETTVAVLTGTGLKAATTVADLVQ